MRSIGKTQTAEERIVQKFTKYLNGPLGQTVLQNLDEGESFILQTSDHTLKVTKRNGRAEVKLQNIPLM